MTVNVPLATLVLIGVGSPMLLLGLLGGASLLNRPLPERWTGALAAGSMTIAFVALLMAMVVHEATGVSTHLLSYGTSAAAHPGGLAIEFLVDRRALAFATLTAAIAGIVSAFSNRYLHREPGYNRYFVLFAMFVVGMLLIALAGTVAVLFVGWELVGLSSALLVAFFHDRPAAVVNAFRVFTVYRISDAAMLAAAVLLRHVAGSDTLSLLFGRADASTQALTGTAATIIAALLLVAVAGKSGLLPFSGWLPRAMEGPTPSSAVYYGSLSIHAGCYLLLRAAPLLEQAPVVRITAGVLGAATALFAGVTTRVQSDVKSSLAYASLTQVGIVIVEIAIGWYTVAFIHLVGHACFRLLQFLSAPNVLHDLHGIEAARGDQAQAHEGVVGGVEANRARRRFFLVAIERGFLDQFLDRIAVMPFIRTVTRLSHLDRWLCGAVLLTERSVADEGRVDDE